MRQNVKRTYEGAPARYVDAVTQLRRSVLACLLWEKEFYEDGEDIASRIETLAAQVNPSEVARLAVSARKDMHLRHVPLFLARVLANKTSGTSLVSDTLAEIIERPDEMGEFLTLYSMNTVQDLNPKARENRRNHYRRLPTLSAQVKKGLRRAFAKFDGYQLAKYNRKEPVTLGDVMRLVHPKPTEKQRLMTQEIALQQKTKADTWESALGGGADKRETFERLLREKRLGYLALLRNLRGMAEAGVDADLIAESIRARRGADKVLPFRYVAAVQACPQFEVELHDAMMASGVLNELPLFDGLSVILVDVSASMDARLSKKAQMTRMMAAAALASMVRGKRRVFTFSNETKEVPARDGLAGVDAILRSQPYMGTYLGGAVARANQIPCERLIVITDEQSHDAVPDPAVGKAYMINVASYQHGVGYGPWTHLDGFSEHVLRWMGAFEDLRPT